MNNLKCCIAKDLMPLYIDDVLSEGSAQELRNHLQTCESCRREYEALTQDLVLPSSSEGREADGRMLRRFKREWGTKKVLISAVSSVLTMVIVVFLFFAAREYIGEESKLFQPSTKAYAGQVGQLYLGELSDGESWTRLVLIKEELFSRTTSWHEEYLEFDNIFYRKRVINSGVSSTAVEMRILDTDGNVVVEPFVVEAGEAVPLEQLENNTPYIVEYRADGDFYEFTFR